MPTSRSSSAVRRRRQTKLPWAPEPAHEDPAPVAAPATESPLSWLYPLLQSTVTWTWRIVAPLLTLLVLAWATGLGHWVAMYAYNALECHRVSWIGLLWAPLDQARPECVLLWRLANRAHWSLFDLFGQLLQMLVPSA